eukprot:CAMPEP_0172312840 /NCGR_PEP_ID=MMETSP1058-20130122/18634_1 /TAXON_ID=83371 /ORGANISM="Detonula confervacea, Strain CCMP 353" /LENGTH=104 /DNA_ID=CAMNT_0013026395 /DNA_START=60 /DNA_END=374 /DNA_ORIENTATION=-
MTMMRSLLTLLAIATVATAFSPSATRVHSMSSTSSPRTTSSPLNMGFGGEPEREKLTRESEPDEFFVTNTDKMSDGDKLPIALMGLAGISLPFIFGLIALYSSK